MPFNFAALPGNMEPATEVPAKIKSTCGKKNKLLAYFREYCAYSGMHGFRYIVEERTMLERVWWIISLILSMIFCGLMIYEIFQKYMNYPVIITFSMKETHLHQIPFPAVTICPRAKISQDYLNLTETFERRFGQDNFTVEDEKILNIASTICDYYATDKNNNGTTADDLYKFLNESRIENYFEYCQYAGVEFDCDFFTPILTEDGICFSFNILDRTDIFNDDVYNFSNFHEHNLSTDWSLEGYISSKSVFDKTYPFRAYRAGVKSSLFVVLKTKYSDNEYECSMDEGGYRLSLHLPSSIPDVVESHFTVPLDQRITGKIIPRTIKTSKGVKTFDASKRDCYFQSEKPLRFFKIYTHENCLIECKTNFTLKYCGCVGFYMPRLNTTPVCILKSIECMEEAEKNFMKLNVHFEITQHGSRANCGCLPTCTDITYNLELSQNKFKFEPRNKSMKLETGVYYSILELYFQKNYVETKERNELYGFSDLVSNFGGLLGLFTGFSILSFMEIIYFLSLRIWGNIRLYNNWSGQ